MKCIDCTGLLLALESKYRYLEVGIHSFEPKKEKRNSPAYQISKDFERLKRGFIIIRQYFELTLPYLLFKFEEGYALVDSRKTLNLGLRSEDIFTRKMWTIF